MNEITEFWWIIFFFLVIKFILFLNWQILYIHISSLVIVVVVDWIRWFLWWREQPINTLQFYHHCNYIIFSVSSSSFHVKKFVLYTHTHKQYIDFDQFIDMSIKLIFFCFLSKFLNFDFHILSIFFLLFLTHIFSMFLFCLLLFLLVLFAIYINRYISIYIWRKTKWNIFFESLD